MCIRDSECTAKASIARPQSLWRRLREKDRAIHRDCGRAIEAFAVHSTIFDQFEILRLTICLYARPTVSLCVIFIDFPQNAFSTAVHFKHFSSMIETPVLFLAHSRYWQNQWTTITSSACSYWTLTTITIQLHFYVSVNNVNVSTIKPKLLQLLCAD